MGVNRITQYAGGFDPDDLDRDLLRVLARAARVVLTKHEPGGSAENKVQKWAREMVAQATTIEERLAVLRFAEGDDDDL